MFLAILAGGLFLLSSAFLEPFCVRARHITIHDADVPPAFENLRIVFAADWHIGPMPCFAARARRTVQRILALQPDVILLGGDYSSRDPIYVPLAGEILSGLRAPMGVYGVMGNHDHWNGQEGSRQVLRQAGVELLDNRGVWLEAGGQRIRLGGVGDIWEDTQELQGLLDGDVRREDFAVLLSHNPDYLAKLETLPNAQANVDLVLSGHTHGGQVALLGLWAPIVPSAYGQRYRAGLVEAGAIQAFVTTGIGTITPPVRLGVPPEIVVVHLSAQ